MTKLTEKQKIEIYERHMAGVPCSQLSKQYHIRATNIQYLIRLITRHGYQIVEKQKKTDIIMLNLKRNNK